MQKIEKLVSGHVSVLIGGLGCQLALIAPRRAVLCLPAASAGVGLSSQTEVIREVRGCRNSIDGHPAHVSAMDLRLLQYGPLLGKCLNEPEIYSTAASSWW